MARTIDTIYQSLLTEKNANTTLSAQLTNVSATARYKLLFYVIAVAVHLLETLFDAHKAEVNDQSLKMIPGTPRWYYEKCLEFQYGDALVWQNNKFEYAVIDATKQIVKRVAISEFPGTIIVKVAKDGSALTTPELDAFKAYISKVKFAGSFLQVTSYSADLIKVHITVKYNPLLMSSTGLLISDGSNAVQTAINSFLSAITYGGILNKTELIDAIQKAEGVLDVYFKGVELEAKSATASLYEICSQNYNALSGHYSLNTLDVNYVV